MKNIKPFRPTKADIAERRQNDIGTPIPWPVGKEPVFASKTIVTNSCVVCGVPFIRPEAICNMCGNCQACGGLNADRFGNICHQCGNHVDQPRFDTLGEIHHI